jgi:hypothetical protein
MKIYQNENMHDSLFYGGGDNDWEFQIVNFEVYGFEELDESKLLITKN